jgi:prepilin-type N-terminal cleavage/methylation domain-containing protein
MGQAVLSGAASRADQRGVTLIEVLVAMVILTTVLMGMAVFAINFTRTVAQSDARTIGVNLAEQRISEIRASPNYSGMETNYNGTEGSISGFPGYSRITAISHIGGPRPTYTDDYKIVTVTVRAPGLTQGIKKTVVVAAP